MTRVVVDRIETQQDKLQFGDPIGCSYHWLEPDEIDAYGDSVRRLATKVELAVDAFDRTATLSEDVFAGEAADTLRGRAGRRLEESSLVRDNLRGLGRAINAYSDVMRRHREGLERLHALATGKGLELQGNRIMPPVETIKDATQKELDRWEAGWKAYRECFDLKIELRDIRRASTRELVRALAEFADVHPDKDRAQLVAADANQVTFGELRREAAEEAMEAVRAGDRADAAQRTVEILKRREQTALDSLERLALAGSPHEEIAAQADRVAVLHRELAEARTDARDLEVTADREQAEANRAARHLADAESGASRTDGGDQVRGELVDQDWQPPHPTDLRDRLG
jgi:hypothetical protein